MSHKSEAGRSLSLTLTRGQLKNFQLEQSATEILVWINTCIDSPIAFNDDQATTASDQLMEALKSGVVLCKVQKELSFSFFQSRKNKQTNRMK